jgi:hypothetical protein
LKGERSWIADAQRDGKRFVVHADEKLAAFVELEAANGLEQSVTPLWGTITVKLPVRAGRHRNSCRVEINQT